MKDMAKRMLQRIHFGNHSQTEPPIPNLSQPPNPNSPEPWIPNPPEPRALARAVARKAWLSTLFISVSMIWLPGCFGPIMSPSASKARKSSSANHHSAAAKHSGSASSLDGTPILRINDQSFEPIQMWRDLNDELIEKTKEMQPSAVPKYLAQRSARWMADKMSESLIYQRAKLRGSPKLEENVSQIVDTQIRKTVTEEHEGIQRRYERFLEAKGLTLDDVKNKLRREILIASYLESEVRPLIAEPTRAQLWESYLSMVEQLKKPERRSMSLIDIRINDELPDGLKEPTRAQWEKAKQAARQQAVVACKEIADGESFAEAAKRHCDGLRGPDGGAWGWVSPGSVRERYEPAMKALFQLGEGEVVGPIEAEDAFMIVRCDNIEEAFNASFPDVQEELKDVYFRKTFNERVRHLIEELRVKARIEPADLAPFHRAVVEASLEKLKKYREQTEK